MLNLLYQAVLSKPDEELEASSLEPKALLSNPEPDRNQTMSLSYEWQ